MGRISPHPPALLLLAAFSRYEGALDWARRQAGDVWGAVFEESPRFCFDQTDYYRPTMGGDLRKVFFVFDRAFDPAELPAIKLRTNQWEEQYAEAAGHAEPRPLNLDPGYLTRGKLVLASTKDHAHRVYLGRGIFGEVTLAYRHGRWQHHAWTFPDYRREDYQRFFSHCRERLR